jgi:hypothetical protein
MARDSGSEPQTTKFTAVLLSVRRQKPLRWRLYGAGGNISRRIDGPGGSLRIAESRLLLDTGAGSERIRNKTILNWQLK